MSSFKPFLFLLILSGFFACQSNSNDSNAFESDQPHIEEQESKISDKLEDGFYVVLNEFTDSTNIIESGGKIITYSYDFLDENDINQPLFLEVNPTDFVPLKLQEKPEGIEQPDERINLMLTLTDESGTDLENFTEKYVNQHICIVINDEAVTMHKIREKITGGRMQITRCTDNACQYLLLELMDNIVE